MNKDDNKKAGAGRFLLVFGVAIAVILMVVFVFNNQQREKHLYSDIVGYFERMEVKAFTLDFGTGELKMQLRADADIDENLVVNNVGGGLFGSSQQNTASPTTKNPKHKGLGNLTKDGDETNGAIITYSVPDVSVFWKTLMGDLGDQKGTNLIEAYNEKYPNAPMVYDYSKATDNTWLWDLIPSIILIVAMIALWLSLIHI